MIPESEWRYCAAPGCGKPIRPHHKEGRSQYARRKYCNRLCKGASAFQHIPLKECANPECLQVVPRDPGMKPCDYARRKSCSPECARRVMRISALTRKPSKPKRIRPAKPTPVSAAPINEADAIAAFIEQRGITYCPPKYAAATLNAALPEREAQRVIKRLQIADNRHASWGWRPQT